MCNTSPQILYKLSVCVQTGELIVLCFPLALLRAEFIKQDYDKTTVQQNKETGKQPLQKEKTIEDYPIDTEDAPPTYFLDQNKRQKKY